MATPAAALRNQTLTESQAAVPVTIQETPAMQRAQSFLEIFYEREKLHPDQVYLRQPEGDHWHTFTWKEVGTQARQVLAALRALGLKRGDHVGLLSKNCAQWIIADIAILMGGFVSVPFYPTLPKDDLHEVISLSHIKALFIGKLEQWAQQEAGVPHEIHCIRFPHYTGNTKVERGLAWEDILTTQKPDDEVFMPSPEDLFMYVF